MHGVARVPLNGSVHGTVVRILTTSGTRAVRAVCSEYAFNSVWFARNCMHAYRMCDAQL